MLVSVGEAWHAMLQHAASGPEIGRRGLCNERASYPRRQRRSTKQTRNQALMDRGS